MKQFKEGLLLALGWCLGCDIYKRIYKEAEELINSKNDEECKKAKKEKYVKLQRIKK